MGISPSGKAMGLYHLPRQREAWTGDEGRRVSPPVRCADSPSSEGALDEKEDSLPPAKP